MKRIKVIDHFHLDELVYPEIYKKFGARSQMFLDMRPVMALNHIRKILDKPLIINNWIDQGPYKYSGLRPFDCPEGAEYSQHKFGRGYDAKCRSVEPEEIQDLIIKHERFFRETGWITTIEINTPGWTHIDNRHLGSWLRQDRIFQVDYIKQ